MPHSFRTVPERLVHFVNRFTIRSILFAGFAVVILLGLTMALLDEWAENYAIDMMDNFLRVDKEIADLSLKSRTAMLSARRNEKDFLLNRKEFGFDEAKSRYISRVLTDLADIREFMKSIRALADDPATARKTEEVEAAVGKYQDELLAVVDRFETLGAHNSGLEAAFRDSAHEMEDLLKRYGNYLLDADLLHMRRREKDFIVRNRDYDVAEFHNAVDRFKKDIAASGLPHGPKGKLQSLTERYRRLFEQYVHTVEEIRRGKKDYIRSVQIIEPVLEQLYLGSIANTKAKVAELKRAQTVSDMARSVTGALALLFSLAVALAISMVISRSVEESRSFAEQIAAGKLENRLAPKGKNEFVTLALALNSMAESLHNANLARIRWAAELRRSREKVRKLNQGLELKVAERTRELVEAQEQLVRTEKLAMLGRIAGNMGNELLNPLGVMNNAVFFLKSVMTDTDETVGEYLGIIKSEIDNSRRIISDLLDFTSAKPSMRRTVAPRELIEESIGRSEIPESVQLQADLPATLPTVNVDLLQMGQVLQNLITNAVQAMPGGGALRISARQVRNAECGMRNAKNDSELHTPHSALDGDFIEISVTDTGEGISPENMKKLFLPLFTTRSRGIGLGLAICKNLTEANGGRIGVASAFGVGTTFTVLLPVEVERLKAEG